MESKETRKLLFFKQNGSTNFSLFLDRKTRGSGFWTIKICFVDHRTIRDTGCYKVKSCFVSNNRIRRRTLRPESLDGYAARDSKWVVQNLSQCEGFEIKGKERETFCECFGERTPFQQGRVQLQDTSQKGRSKKRIHTVNPFCFVIYCPYRLINHFEECSS